MFLEATRLGKPVFLNVSVIVSLNIVWSNLVLISELFEDKMKYSNVIFLGVVVLSGCSPLDRYLGFTPIDRPKTETTQLQKTKNNSAQNSSDSSSSSNSSIGRSASLTGPNTNAVSTNIASPNDNASDTDDTEVALNTNTGGPPNGTSASHVDPPVFLVPTVADEPLPETN